MSCLSKKQLALLPATNIFFTEEDLQPAVINKDFSVIVSKSVKAPFLFDSLVMSLSAKLNKNAAILVQASVKTSKGWSAMYKLAYISNNYKKSFDAKQDEYARVNIDTLLTKEPAQYFKYQITVLGKAKLTLAAAALTKAKAKYDKSLALETLDLRDFELSLKPISQIQSGGKLKNRICSPVSLAMVLDFYGKKTALEEIIAGVYDENSKIYGNWPINTAYGAQLGLNACVLRCCSIAQAEGEIYKGKPVIASIAYKAGKLKKAAVKETEGHIVVITGFDKDGNIIVMDPAAKTATQVRRVYDRAEFAEAWLKNKKGLTYALED